MKTLLIPCAGSSSRFPNMRPKWMLTHPDGKLMIEKSLEGINIDFFDRIIIVILQTHIEKFNADIILKQAFINIKNVEIVVLPFPTSSASETVYQAVKKLSLTGGVVVKDSDNCINLTFLEKIQNCIGALNINTYKKNIELRSKSFLLLNDNNIVMDIIEKKVISDCICVGVYSFQDINDFSSSYLELLNENIVGEIYLSHVISYMISVKKIIFQAIHVTDFKDWGTIQEWKIEQQLYKSFFIDFDGVCIKNSGKYGIKNWDNNNDFIIDNLNTIRHLQETGSQIIITTSRPKKYEYMIQNILNKFGIFPYAIITGLNHAPRILINDFAPTNPYPSAIAINIHRNENLKDYIAD